MLSGAVVACELVKHACRRHVRDLSTAKSRGLYFDPDAADLAVQFFPCLKHSKGRWAGSPFELAPWQQFIIWSLYGWKRAGGKRRFREAYIEVARKNGKSTMCAGLALLGLIDDEPGAEVYSGATKEEQARIIHNQAKQMVRSSELLSEQLDIRLKNISYAESESKYEPLGSDSKTLDGLNVYMAILDELHAHKSRDLYDVIDSATGSRAEPLMISITTAGFSQDCFCYEQRTRVENMLTGVIDDDSLFGVVYTLDEGDDWKNEATWIKANPNLEVSNYLEGMREAYKKALAQPSAQPNFQCKLLNQWVNVAGRYLSIEDWKACRGRRSTLQIEEASEGRRIWCGLDLSKTNDLTALVALVEPAEPLSSWELFCRFWLPGDDLAGRSARASVPYKQWSEEGYLIPTPGRIVDFAMVYEEILALDERYEIVSIGHDPAYARHLVDDLLGEGIECHEVRQGWKTISPAMMEMERWVLARRLAHGGNPVLQWMAANLQVRTVAGNIMPDRPDVQKSNSKIDGMVALIMAIDRATAPVEELPAPAYTATEGIKYL